MKHRNLISRALGLLSLLFVAHAATAEGLSIKAFSLGLSATRAPVSVDDAGTIYSGDADGWRIFGSYMFTRNFGVEAGMSNYGSPNDSSIPSDMQVETDSLDVYAVAAYPITNNFDLIGKVGYVSWNTETEVNDTDEKNYNSDNLALSFGGEYDIRKHFAVRGELEWFDSVASGDLKYSLSAVVGFD